MRLFIAVLLVAVLGCVYSTSVVCSKFAKDVADGPGVVDLKKFKTHRYYVRPIPGNCRTRHNWRPTFRIKEPWTKCKDGFRKYKNACYRLAKGNADLTFPDGERICNRHQGHIVTWKDRQEFMWIHNNIANQNKWYWVGIFCGTGDDIRNHYAITGEDMRKIGPKWGFKGHQPLSRNKHPCYMWHRNNRHYMKHFHHHHCHDTQGTICKSPLA